MKIPDDWKKVKFGDVVNKINDKVPNRDEWTFNRYIGGEHFDEGEIRITRSAPIEGNEEVIGSAFHVKFKPGQVLYVTRNPRLRKGGMVDFEGVCSNVSFVMEADEKQLLQSLLPFVIQTEDFVKHTCNNAHGSTNPFLNWKDIAKYEFLLPPIEEQKKISEVLWIIEKSLIELERYIKITYQLKNRATSKLLTKGLNHSNFKKSNFGEIPSKWSVFKLRETLSCEINNGINKNKEDFGFGTKFVNIIDNYCYDEIDTQKLGRMNVTKKEIEMYSLQKGDITLVRSSVKPSGVAYPAIFPGDKEPVVFCGFVMRLRPNKKVIIPKYLLHYLRWEKIRKIILSKSGRSAITNVNQKALSELNIIVPNDINEQRDICDLIDKYDNQIHTLENQLLINKNLRNKLSNELLKGELRLN